GNVDPGLPLAEQPLETLYYAKFDTVRPHVSGKIMICGHTAQKSGAPAIGDAAVCIDTWVYGAGWLTCLDVLGGRVWQADQQGRRRTAWLNDFAGTVQLLEDSPLEGTGHG